MTTKTLTFDASQFQARNWDLPDDERTVVIAAVRDAGGETDHESYRTDDNEIDSRFAIYLDNETYYSFAVERVDLTRYKVHLNTEGEWEKQSTDLSFLVAITNYFERIRRGDN